MLLNKEQLRQLVRSASLYTTGGGLPPQVGEQSIAELAEEIRLELRDLTEFNPDDYLAMVAEIGPASAPEVPKEGILPEMLAGLTQLTGKKIAGFYVPEVGQESCLINCALAGKLPMADFEPAGCRAVPCVDMSILNLLDIPCNVFPAAVATFQGEICYFSTVCSDERSEVLLRNFTAVAEHQIIFTVGNLVAVRDLLQAELLQRPFRHLLEMGQLTTLTEFIDREQPKAVLRVRVMSEQSLTRQGFDLKRVRVEELQSHSYFTLDIMNETLILQDEQDQVVYAVPDRILLVDEREMLGIPSSALCLGQELCIVVLPPYDIWQTHPKASQIFGPQRFMDFFRE